jgi:hypothetical protein
LGAPTDRQAGLAAMDVDGQVASGMVSDELLRVDAPSAFGLEIDPAVHAQAFARLWAESDVVIAELSDLERAEAARADATSPQETAQFRRALRQSDALVGDMIERVDLSRDTVILVGPTAPSDRNQLTMFAMAGPGISTGWASSSTTRREGYVTLTDIAPTVLARLGIDVPDEMSDTRLTSTSTDQSLDDRIGWMIDQSDRAIARDAAFGPITVVFVVAVVVDIALGMLCLARVGGLAGAVRGLALVVLAVPPVTFLLGLVPIRSPGVLGAGVGAGALVVAVLASFLRRVDSKAPPVALFGLLWLVLAVDIVTGGHLQINTVFGYSPIVAGRFAGFGNQAFSMIALSALLLGAEYVDGRADDHESLDRSAPVRHRLRRRASSAPLPGVRPAVLAAVVGGWFLVTVVLDGHPSFGADVGGVLAFVPAAMVSLLLFLGIKIRVRLMALIAAGTMGLLAVFAAIDVSRPEEDRTHLGRFVAKLFNGEAGEIIQRKIAANLRVLTSVWAWVIPVALVYFVYLTWRPNRTFQRLNDEHHQFRAFGISALVLGVLAMGFNDSGVSMPAMMVALTAAFVSYLVIDLERSP